MLALSFLAWSAAAQAGEAVSFPSRTYEDIETLLKAGASSPVGISGQLELPPGTGPFPALVLAHTCAGYNEAGSAERTQLAAFLKAGWAVLVYDSFQPRDLRNVCGGGGGSVAQPATVTDAYAALSFLSQDKRIRADRIVVAGASFGGMTAWLAAQEPFRRVLAEGDRKFAAHVAYYPAINFAFATEKPLTGAPMLLLLGGDDDWTPAWQAKAVLDYLKPRATLPEIVDITYANAHHGWLDVENPRRRYLAGGRSGRECPVVLRTDAPGEFVLLGKSGSVDTAKGQADLQKMRKNCVSYGVTIEGNASVTAKSLDDSFAFLKRVLPQ
jgi:dienelactone hydrolase